MTSPTSAPASHKCDRSAGGICNATVHRARVHAPVAQGAPVPADHGLTVHRDGAGAYAYPRTHGRADLRSDARRDAVPDAGSHAAAAHARHDDVHDVHDHDINDQDGGANDGGTDLVPRAQVARQQGAREPGHHAATALPRQLRPRRAVPCQPEYRCSVIHELTKILGCVSTLDEAIDCVRENQDEDVNCVA